MATSQIHQLHFLLIPLMSQSHLIPFTDMAKLLAHRGLTVTIITTPLNAIRFKSFIDHAINSSLKIHLIPLKFPCREAGLPEGCENMDSLPSPDLVPQFFTASNMLQDPLEKFLATLEPQPSCMIADICFPWAADVAVKFNIPRIVFNSVSCFTLFCSHNMHQYKVHESVASDSELFLVPNMPDEIEFTRAQLPAMMKESIDDWGEFLDQMKAAELSAEGVVVNTLEELEAEYVKGYQKVVNKIWCIGPVSLCNKEKSDKLERGNKAAVNEHQCLEWLDLMHPNSVIYVCFGTLCHLPALQLIEIGLGLESSNCPFIWIIKRDNYSDEIEKWLEEDKFEERVRGRGLIIRGWAPQVLILSHPSIGGFLTHCGWNSTLEGVCTGVPMITWPMFAEQFYNEKLIVKVWKIGVRVGVEVCMEWGEEEKVGVLVRREKVKKAIEQLMDEGEESVERRKRAREFGGAAKRAVEGGGSSYSNMTLMIQHVMQQVSHDKSSPKEN